jgi:hypothetical protein
MAADRSRLAAALAYKQAEEERRRRMLESIPTPAGTTPAQPAPQTDFRTNLENLSIGLGKGLTNQLEGIKGMVTDPVGTAKGVYEAGKAVVRDPAIIASALRQMGQKAMSGPLGAGEVMGEMVSPTRGAGGVGRRDIFIGKSAKTWNEKQADRALAMEAVGVDPETIWQETGTFRAPDGEWRQEISDFGAKGVYTHLPPSEERLAQMVLEHPELLEAYPDLANIRQFGLREPKARGSYEVTHIQTEDGPKVLGEALVVRGPDEEALASTALHEMQHAIQRREGFQRGANPAEFKDKKIPANLRDVVFSRSMREMAIANKMRELGYPVAEGKVLNLNRPDTLRKVEKYAENDQQLGQLVAEWQQANDKLKKYPDKYTQYARTAGEVEARAVEARRKMTPEERRATFPMKSYDVPPQDVIVRKVR